MPTWKDTREAHTFMDHIFFRAMRIVSDGVYTYNHATREHVRTYDGRSWFSQQRTRHSLHPAVYDMMTEHMYRPYDWQQLMLEWPHKSMTDPNRLAYTRDERSAMHNGDSDIKAVITTIGKYLTRHFPDAPSNLIRDIAAKYTYGGTTEITKDLDRMVYAVINGPRSCMSPSFDITCDDRVDRHPYAVYDPSLGWGMAVRTDTDGMVLGRCLVHESDEGKGFVRSYKRERDYSSSSGTDESIEAYLQGLGYAKWRGWPAGLQLMRYPLRRDSGFLMPYIDGNCQHVGDDGDVFRISSYDGVEATNTSGTINSYEYSCDDCGAGFHDGDGGWTGIHEENHVCQHCLENAYNYAYSRRGNEYYIRNDDTIEVGGEYYDVNYLSDNSIVELHDGEYEHSDNAVYIESEDTYYHCDDDDICYAEDTNQHELKDNCWQCTESGNWYTDDEEYVEVDGDKYHPDHVPESAQIELDLERATADFASAPSTN
jgi:hypothetical protein